MAALHSAIIVQAPINDIQTLLHDNNLIDEVDSNGKYPLQYLKNDKYGQTIKGMICSIWNARKDYAIERADYGGWNICELDEIRDRYDNVNFDLYIPAEIVCNFGGWDVAVLDSEQSEPTPCYDTFGDRVRMILGVSASEEENPYDRNVFAKHYSFAFSTVLLKIKGYFH